MTDQEGQGAGNPSDSSEELNLSELSTEELEQLLADGSEDTEAPEGEASETSEGGDKIPKQRLRPRDNKDQQVLDLYKSEGFEGSFQDATQVIYGASTEPTKSESAGNAPAEDKGTDKVQELRNEITALANEADQAAEDMETSKALAAQRAIQKKEIEILKLEQKKEQTLASEQQAEIDQYRQAERASQDRVFTEHPVLANQDSTERKLFESWVQEKQNDPEYAPVFQSPRWTELLVGEFAAKHLPKQEAPVQAPAKHGARILTSANTSTPSSNNSNSNVTADQIRQNIDNLDRETLYKLLG